MLHLRPIERLVNFQLLDDILAEENAPALLHIVELDGKAVGRSANFLFAQQERGRIAVAPPLEDWLAGAKFGRSNTSEHAQDVEIREFSMVVAGSGRPIENDGHQTLLQGLAQTID